MSERVFSVSDILTYLKKQFSNDYFLTNINVEGEIGNFTNHSSGHWYFTLKDYSSLINCCMFHMNNVRVGFIPKNGDKVILKANVSIYERSGQLQLVATAMKLSGEGDFYVQFEKMKKKLSPLGYFDESRKKKIPLYPETISIVTGANTAALQDIIITISKRWPVVKLKIHNAIVQGKEALESIPKALKQADEDNSDVMILARGGGSVDDLWCFNDEGIATAIYNLKTPIVTGIGHEIDFTIADLVADKRCATPTAAAQAVTPDYYKVREQVDNCTTTISNQITNMLQNYQQQYDYCITSLSNYQNRISNLALQITNMNNSIASALKQRVSGIASQIDAMSLRIMTSYRSAIANEGFVLENSAANVQHALKNLLLKKQSDFSQILATLDGVSPLKTMQRGYSLVYSNDKLVKSVNEIQINDKIVVQFLNGKAKAEVYEKEKD